MGIENSLRWSYIKIEFNVNETILNEIICQFQNVLYVWGCY